MLSKVIIFISQSNVPPLLCDVHLVLQVTSVCCFSVFNLPTQILNLSFQLSLLILKLKKIYVMHILSLDAHD